MKKAKKENHKSPSILVVEDDVTNSNMLREILEEECFIVTQAYTGEEALTSIEKQEIDLIILDLMLPDVDGFKICKKLKTARDTNIIPILMLSALSDYKNKINGIEVGANSFISKPFDVDVMLSEIKKLLEWREQMKNRPDYECVDFTLNSEIQYLDELNNMISSLLQKTNLTNMEIEEIKSGIYEIGVNAIEWGNKFNKHLLVKVKYEITSDYFKITIEDEGEGFNFRKYLSQQYNGYNTQDNRENEGKRLGGFGIVMTKFYFDSITYNDKGNIAVLEKKFTKKAK